MDTKEFKDYYKILDINSNATAEEIKKAYRTKAHKYHPDNYANASDEVKKEYENLLKEVTEAYSTLKDTVKKYDYDKKYQAYYGKNNANQSADKNTSNNNQSANKNTSNNYQQSANKNTSSNYQQSANKNTSNNYQQSAYKNTSSNYQQSANKNTSSNYQQSANKNTSSNYQQSANKNTSSNYQQSANKNTSSNYQQSANKNTSRNYQQQTSTNDFTKQAYYQHHNNAYKNAGPKRRQHSVFESLVNDYKAVRREERRFNFAKRHRYFTRKIHDRVDRDDQFYKLKNGMLHVYYESLYQFYNLTSIKLDTLPRYILRNRKFIGTVLLSSFILLNVSNQKDIDIDGYQAPYTTTQTTTDDKNYINITRHYEIRGGDTLTSISKESQTPIATIAEINSFYSDLIYVGDVITVPYKIALEDLEYYTTTVKYDKSKSLDDYAKMYETTKEDIIALNKDAITNIDGQDVIMSDYILVPNFISRQNLKELKSNVNSAQK